MKQLNKTEKLAFNQQHPKLPIVAWQIWQYGVLIYENQDIRLAKHFVKLNNLKIKPTPKR